MTATEIIPAERDRKLEHIRLALEDRMQVEHRAFDDWSLEHVALPEIDLAEIDCRTTFLGKPLAAPLLVSSMTGGTDRATSINRNLAEAAERAGIALAVGSQRKALEDAETAGTFVVRDVAPTIPVLANLGAVQLNYGYGPDECRRAVEMIDADALILHLNPLQEAIQPEGQGNFRSLIPKIREVVDRLPVPVVVKEIGCGLSGAVGRRLVEEAGVRILDTAGVGGTSWARIEAARADDRELGEVFAAWGVETPEAIRQLGALEVATVIGSGGVRTGIDVAKAVALGADLVGFAQPLLAAALESADAVSERLRRMLRELEITMFCCGARDLAALREVPIRRGTPDRDRGSVRP